MSVPTTVLNDNPLCNSTAEQGHMTVRLAIKGRASAYNLLRGYCRCKSASQMSMQQCSHTLSLDRCCAPPSKPLHE